MAAVMREQVSRKGLVSLLPGLHVIRFHVIFAYILLSSLLEH